MRPTVLVSSPIHEAGLEILRRSFNVIEQFYLYDKTDFPALHAALGKADAVITRSLPMKAELIDMSPRLQLIAKHGAGLNTIDVEHASRQGILVSNTGGANSLSVAEGAVAMMLAVLRRVPDVHAMVAEGRFADRIKLPLFGDLWGRTVGVVGFGHIGRTVAKICGRGFDSTILAYDPQVDAQAMHEAGARKIEKLEDLLAEADIVSIHVPLTSGTRHLIGARQLAAMKPGAIIVNTSRGGVVDEAALSDALQAGLLGGAGIDVFETEPPQASNPLLGRNDVVLSPHVAGSTEAARKRTAIEAAQAVEAVLAGSRPAYLINPQVWDARRKAAA